MAVWYNSVSWLYHGTWGAASCYFTSAFAPTQTNHSASRGRSHTKSSCKKAARTFSHDYRICRGSGRGQPTDTNRSTRFAYPTEAASLISIQDTRSLLAEPEQNQYSARRRAISLQFTQPLTPLPQHTGQAPDYTFEENKDLAHSI